MLTPERQKKLEAIVVASVNMALQQYGVDFNHVINNPMVNGVQWFQYYTFKSKSDYDGWRRYTIKLLQQVALMSKRTAHKYFSAIDLAYGLKTKATNDKETNTRKPELEAV